MDSCDTEFRLRLSLILHTYVYSALKVNLDGSTTESLLELLKLCIWHHEELEYRKSLLLSKLS